MRRPWSFNPLAEILMEPHKPVSAAGSADVVTRIDTVMAHAWMVRTFVKHSDEVEDFPELMQVARTIFDATRALETKRDDPAAMLKMLQKKFGRLRKAAEQFRHDAPLASDHTNFKQAVVSLDGCVRQLEEILQEGSKD